MSKTRKAVLFIVLFFPLSAHATSYYFKTFVELSRRENSLYQHEVPFNVYVDTGLKEMPQDGTFDVSVKNNWIKRSQASVEEFDLYQAVLRFRDIGEVVNVSVGRQFLNPGFHAYLMDGVDTTIGKGTWPVEFELFGGVPRYLENGDFSGNSGFVGGATLNVPVRGGSGPRFSIIYNALDLGKNDWKQNDTVLVGVADSQTFGGKSRPTVYTNAEYNIAGKDLETGVLGFSFQPHWRLYWNVEGGYYDTNRAWGMQTIFGSFGRGAYYQARTGISVTAVEDAGPVEELVFTAGYSYQRLKVPAGWFSNGNLADGGVSLSLEPLMTDIGLVYRYYDSFGGRANDFYGAVHCEPLDMLSFDAGGEFTKYSQITNVRNDSTSAFLTANVDIIKSLTLSVGGEYLRNVTFKNTWRVLGLLSYNMGGKL